MKTKPMLEFSDVATILEHARKMAVKHQFAVCIAVVDEGGHLLGLIRLDGCAPVGVEIAIGKARTAALGRRESRLYEEMVNGGRIAFISADTVTALEGGVPILVDGQVVGAVGVSGVKPNEDSLIAKAGATALSTAG